MRTLGQLFVSGAAGALVVVALLAGTGPLTLRDDGVQFPDGTVQTTAAAGGAPVEDTGQMQCFDENGNSRACTGTGEDGEFQAGVAWPTPRFTDNGDGTVRDNLTGLIWLKDANCPAGTKTWQQALDWVASLNTMSIACTDYAALTFTDWRLANIKELLSLVDYGQAAPALPPLHPFVNVQLSHYWSSSTAVLAPAAGWAVLLNDGQAVGPTKVSSRFVWPVRGGQ